MTQEQKAKAYDESYKVAESIHRFSSNPAEIKRMEQIFPTLKESEDERIRKVLIDFFNRGAKNEEETHGIPDKDILAWLEKQGEHQRFANNIVEIWKDMRLEVYQQASGNRHEPNYSDDTTKMYSLNDIDEIIEKMSEQKPADKVEPKFHEGDWVVNNATLNLCHILKIEHGQYICDDCSFPITKENEYHLWTIQDAKEGDVLAFDDDTIVIFKDLYNSSTFHSYSYIEEGIFNTSDADAPDWWNGEGFKPATKEQHDILFKKMKEAGYKLDKDFNLIKI